VVLDFELSAEDLATIKTLDMKLINQAADFGIDV